MNKLNNKTPLLGDPKRQASDPLKGYAYQIWQSVYAWLKLQEEEVLFLEGAEDYDIIDIEKATVVQVKDTSNKITLRSASVIDAINNFWKLHNQNPEKNILFKYLTRSKITNEQGNPFGDNIPGLIYWHQCKSDLSKIDILRSYMLEDRRFSELHDFLSNSEEKTIQDKLIQPITWLTENDDVDGVVKAIERKLIIYGDKHNVPASKSKSVAQRLFLEAIKVACNKNNDHLAYADFMMIFEEETSEFVSNHEMQLMREVKTKVFESVLEFNNQISIQMKNIVQTAIPPLPEDLFVRKQLVQKLESLLYDAKVLLLNGSTGMGKTILAKMIANNNPEEWLWLNLSKHESVQATEIINQASLLLEDNPETNNVLLDNLDMSIPNVNKLEDYLSSLFYTITERMGYILITSSQPLPQNLIRRLNINPRSEISVPPFEENEIYQFITQLGCPDTSLSKSWSKIVLVQTSGHPQLVHACLLHLSNENWPKITSEDIVTSPSKVDKERSETRQLLENLPEEHRELLYRMSIVFGPVRRDHAMAIGGYNPPIKFPGDALDQLVGPWIEEIDEKYYRISPLLNNAAKQVWTADNINSHHAKIAHAIVKCSKLSLLEARNIFFHAWIGRANNILAQIIQSLIFAPENSKPTIAHEMSFIVYACLSLQKSPVPNDTFINSMFRMLQFQVATEIKSETALEIVNYWDKELVQHEPQESYIRLRFLFLTQVFFKHQVDIPPKQLISYLIEISNLYKQLETFGISFDTEELCDLSMLPKNNFDPITFFFQLIWLRNTSIVFFDELLDELDQLTEEYRNRMLVSFKHHEAYAYILVNNVWLQEADRDNPDWESCIRVFEKALDLGLRWNAPVLAAAVAHAITVVYDEYLHESDTALNRLKEIQNLIPISPALEDTKANILSTKKEYDKAVIIWEKILPAWRPAPESLDNRPIFALRNAGVAAAHIPDWLKSADFFHEGYLRSKEFNLDILSTGFIADTGFAYWKAGKYKESIDAFSIALESLSKLPDSNSDLKSFIVIKLVGHSINWIWGVLSNVTSENIVEPNPGLCSNPIYNEKFRELPLPTLDLSWMQLSEIEYYLETGSKIFNLKKEILLKSELQSVCFFVNQLIIKYDFRNLTFDNLPSQMNSLIQMFYEMHKSNNAIIDSKNFIEYQKLSTDVYFATLICLLSKGKFDKKILGIWEKDVKDLPNQNTTIQWIKKTELIFKMSLNDAVLIMINEGEKREDKMLAGFKVCIDNNCTLDMLFYAHCMLVNTLIQYGNWGKEVSDYIADLLSFQWKSKIQFKAVFRMPNITIPQIEEACNSGLPVLEKIANILLAVRDAVNVKLPNELVQWLRNPVYLKG